MIPLIVSLIILIFMNNLTRKHLRGGCEQLCGKGYIWPVAIYNHSSGLLPGWRMANDLWCAAMYQVSGLHHVLFLIKMKKSTVQSDV